MTGGFDFNGNGKIDAMDHAIKLAKEYITANRRLYRADIKVTKTMIEDA